MSALLNQLRWWLFKQLSAIGWAICPEPQKTTLQSNALTWTELNDLWLHEEDAALAEKE